ncbi:GNAT family N-acetyltransferase [Kaistia dalseonensis]|uniref:GNAT superfamily N-acetyltransferase n=1 Tax=Kaistia dalseonensis TaxID=410840 RepID=A0ABU0H9N9_9HYPH|nr:GNAT family N-acetyltransferase [Kaistia dalseonensis]MCX5496418.1 GNAT family N-acetyltransferase [Kaistia dalseonensis]MDQ0439039.1 GNAT superfamily N-acetyltransferase [Kaistia dalseonensis]
MMASIPLDLDGYTDLPPGLIANVVTYLEMPSPTIRPARPAPELSVRRIMSPTLDEYRALYRRIGHDWLWFSRIRMPDETLRAMLEDPNTEVYFLERDGAPIGLAELRRAKPEAGNVEIGMFGVVPEARGSGAGSVLMASALESAWRGDTRRVWLHTCTFDDPAAIHFYRKHGFQPFKFAIEVSEDPRLLGLLPPTAGRHVALIEPKQAG